MESLLTRMSACRDTIADLKNRLRAEMDRRDSLICEAISGGEKYIRVARASGRSIGTVAAIVGRGDPLDPEKEEREKRVLLPGR